MSASICSCSEVISSIWLDNVRQSCCCATLLSVTLFSMTLLSVVLLSVALVQWHCSLSPLSCSCAAGLNTLSSYNAGDQQQFSVIIRLQYPCAASPANATELAQRPLEVEPASLMTAWHWPSVWLAASPANTRRGSNFVSTLGHRLRRWPNIDPTLAYRLVLVARAQDSSLTSAGSRTVILACVWIHSWLSGLRVLLSPTAHPGKLVWQCSRRACSFDSGREPPGATGSQREHVGRWKAD